MIHRCFRIGHRGNHSISCIHRIADWLPVLVLRLCLHFTVYNVRNKSRIHIGHDQSVFHGITGLRTIFQKIGIIDQPAHCPVRRLPVSVMLRMDQDRLHFYAVILFSVHIAGDQDSFRIFYLCHDLWAFAVSAASLHNRNPRFGRICRQPCRHLFIFRAKLCITLRHDKRISTSAHILHRPFLFVLIQISWRFYASCLIEIHHHLVTVLCRILRCGSHCHHTPCPDRRRVIFINIPVV